MTEEELSKWATKLIQRFDNTKIIGAGGEWSGDTRQGFMFNPRPKGPAETTPTVSGACCYADGSCAVVTQTICEAGGGIYQGDGTDCDPNPCGGGEPTGACCIDGSCSITTEATCTDAGGVYQGNGTTCTPNPCGSCATAPCYPSNMRVTVTPSGDVGVRGECQIDPPGRVTLSSSPIVVFDGDVPLDGSGICCVGGGGGTSHFPVEGGTNEACCELFGYPTYSVFGWTFLVEWCPDEMQWRVCAELGIGGGAATYCNWPPVTISWFPSGKTDCFSDIAQGQTSVTLTLESSDWAFLTFSVEIDLTWVGC